MGLRRCPVTWDWITWMPDIYYNESYNQIKRFTKANWAAFRASFTIYIFLMVFIGQAWALSGEEIDLLIPTIIMAESSGNPMSVGDNGKSRGLMQIQKSTWKAMSDLPWDAAFDEGSNVQVGRKILEKINEVYLAHGVEADKAHLIYTYNVGRYCWGKLPKWTKNHPNLVYREIYNAK